MKNQLTANFKGIAFTFVIIFFSTLVFTCESSPEEIKAYMYMLKDPQDETTAKAQEKLG